MDVDWNPHLGAHGDAPHAQRRWGAPQPTISNSTSAPSAGGSVSHQYSIDPAGSKCAALGATAAASAAAASAEEQVVKARAGFPLRGFLRVELVGLEEAEVTFRPGKARRAALVAERENAAAEEKKVKLGERRRRRERRLLCQLQGGGVELNTPNTKPLTGGHLDVVFRPC